MQPGDGGAARPAVLPQPALPARSGHGRPAGGSTGDQAVPGPSGRRGPLPGPRCRTRPRYGRVTAGCFTGRIPRLRRRRHGWDCDDDGDDRGELMVVTGSPRVWPGLVSGKPHLYAGDAAAGADQAPLEPPSTRKRQPEIRLGQDQNSDRRRRQRWSERRHEPACPLDAPADRAIVNHMNTCLAQLCTFRCPSPPTELNPHSGHAPHPGCPPTEHAGFSGYQHDRGTVPCRAWLRNQRPNNREVRPLNDLLWRPGDAGLIAAGTARKRAVATTVPIPPGPGGPARSADRQLAPRAAEATHQTSFNIPTSA